MFSFMNDFHSCFQYLRMKTLTVIKTNSCCFQSRSEVLEHLPKLHTFSTFIFVFILVVFFLVNITNVYEMGVGVEVVLGIVEAFHHLEFTCTLKLYYIFYPWL